MRENIKTKLIILANIYILFYFSSYSFTLMCYLSKNRRFRANSFDSIQQETDFGLQERYLSSIYHYLYQLRQERLISKDIYFNLIDDDKCIQEMAVIKYNNIHKYNINMREHKLCHKYIIQQKNDEIDTFRSISTYLQKKKIFHPFAIIDIRRYIEHFIVAK